ncbi:MAG: hypothetical protein WCG26_00190 [Chloroflexales bacterium]
MKKLLLTFACVATMATMASAGWPWYRPVHNQGEDFNLDSSVITNAGQVIHFSGGQSFSAVNATGLVTRVGALETGATVASTNAVAATRLTGNVALAAVTNAAATLGSHIRGNIPLGSLTNALPGVTRTLTNVVWNAGATTGNVVFINGLLQ